MHFSYNYLVKHYLGVDIGSVNVRLSLVDEAGGLLYRAAGRIASNPRITVNSLLAELGRQHDPVQIAATGVSGAGRTVVPQDYRWVEYSSSLAIAAGLLHDHPDARTIMQIGGHNSLVIELEDGLKKPWKVVSNPLCAAGTGVFLEQQAYRLGVSLDDFAGLALACRGNPPRIAARCSVFAKTDLIHLQQKGAPLEAMCYALCESIARMVASLKKGAFAEPVYFVGGVAANPAIVKALSATVSARNGHDVPVSVPDDYLFVESYGAALLARGKESHLAPIPGADMNQRYFQMPPLEHASSPIGDVPAHITQKCRGYLGVDVGSTSTKAVILDETGRKILAKNYLMTAGRPVDAVKEVFRNLLDAGAGIVEIAAAGVTGSGRYLIGSLIGADLVKNEITAQTRAAVEIDPEADIIELGGQDSKLVIKRNGVVVDYQMNKACAAGTGSFIDEMAETLGVSVKDGQFAGLAFKAPHTIDLGTRCAAFMGQAVASARQEGVPLEIITASLAGSIARNYLSKVVGHRRLGQKIILTGAVFYNEAVVSAFHEELKDRNLTVAEHREVSGAIGVALLAKEAMSSPPSRFKGFQRVSEGEVKLTTFTCKRCDDNCAITQMRTPNEKPTFYGSRCDRYDSLIGGKGQQTAFDEREKLLLKDYREGVGAGPLVGIPRALIVYDYAPLLIGFLNSLGARVILSGQTSKKIMEQSVELSYTDSCFPVKLLHGHAASLASADFILYPSAIRLGRKEGEENQKYACPLVQASPFIVRHVLNLGDKLLAPILDFSLGDREVIENLGDAARKMGFSRRKGIEAALAGLAAQRQFETGRAELGKELLAQVRRGDRPGVVLLTRSYVSQDSGANLGIAQKLAQLGVVPVPLDCLPLETIDPKQYSDRPYWSYEGKFIAAAALTASDPRLYGLVLTNFGCGPNSFILKILEDIMGAKPMGQLEIDEHAAEAGIVTRLEAFVDTITQHARYGRHTPAPTKSIYRGTTPTSAEKTVLIPRMAPHAEAVGAALQAYGVSAAVLPEPDERNLLQANQVTSGTECLPFRVTLGDFMRYYRENGNDTTHVEGFMTGSYGPCRLGKYAIEHIRILREIGFDLPLLVTVSNNAYGDFKLGTPFDRLLWTGIVAVDYLQKLLWRTRPYEKQNGTADGLFGEYLTRIADCVRARHDLPVLLRQASSDFTALIDPALPRRPLVGINGEAYLRLNEFSNRHLAKVCENAGLEVVVSPVSEWIRYTAYRNLEDAVKNRNLSKAARSFLRKNIMEHDERTVAKCFGPMVDGKEPSTAGLLSKSADFISSRCGSEAVLSTGSGIEWMESPTFAGVISVMPHGCMPGGIVAAMADKFSAQYNKPWISLTYDGFQESTNLARVNEFAELIRFCKNNGK